MKTIKRTIEFLDAENNKVIFDAEITERNGYPVFTASGQYCGGGGQCFDNVKPDGDNQAKLIKIWRKWHLNGMHAGTKKQSELTKGLDYDETVKKLTSIDRETNKESFFSYSNLTKEIKRWSREIDILNKWHETGLTPIVETRHHPKHNEEWEEESKDTYYNRTLAEYQKNLKDADDSLKTTLLYDIHPVTGELYKYGSAWLRSDLPEDFEDDLNNLMDDIEQEEEEKQERKVTEEDLDLFQDFDRPEVCLALSLMLDLCVNEIEDITENSDTRYTVQGVDYLAGNDDEMEEEWENYLDSYIDDCIEIPAEIEGFFDRNKYIEYLKQDGRGHSLNSWDGGEESINLNGTDYFAYRN